MSHISQEKQLEALTALDCCLNHLSVTTMGLKKVVLSAEKSEFIDVLEYLKYVRNVFDKQIEHWLREIEQISEK